MNTATRVMIYCPLCQGKLLAQKAIVEGTLIHCPLCSRDFRFSSMKNHRSEPLVIPFVEDSNDAGPVVAPKAYLQNADLIKNADGAKKVAFESGSKLTLQTPLKPIPVPPAEVQIGSTDTAKLSVPIAAQAGPVLAPVNLAPILVPAATRALAPAAPMAAAPVALELAPSLELEPGVAPKAISAALPVKAPVDRRIIPLKPVAAPKPVVPGIMAAQFYLAAVPEKVPSTKLPYVIGLVVAMLTLAFLGVVLYPIARAKYWPGETTEALVADVDPNAGTEASPYTEQVARPYRPPVAPPLEPDPAEAEERLAKRAADAEKRRLALEQEQADKAERDRKKAEDDEVQRLQGEAKKIRLEEIKKAEDDRLEKLRLADIAKQNFDRKKLINKIKSETTFIHDDGQGKYDATLREMNSAQEDYNYQNRAATSRAKSALLSHAIEGINVAFNHGLKSYDYMIKKKTAQLDAALDIETEGMPQEDKDRVKVMLEEGRWLTRPGALIYWLGGNYHPRGANWYHNATIVTAGDLYAHDRSGEVEVKQKKADKKFIK